MILAKILICLILGNSAFAASPEIIKETFANGQTSNEYYYVNGQLIQQRYYSDQGQMTGWLRFTYPKNGHVIKAILSLDKKDYGQIKDQEEWIGLDSKNRVQDGSQRVKRWVFQKEAPNRALYVESFDLKISSRVLSRDYLNEKGQVNSTMVFSYQGHGENPVAFKETDSHGKVLSQYKLYEEYNPTKRLHQLGKTDAEIKILESQRLAPGKVLVAIIDSGFDYNHSELISKWWSNPADPIDGIDNDNNGWIDDNFGWDQVKNIGLPSETTSGFQKDDRPLSHGTHVAHIASRDLDNVALIGFGGDYTQASYIQKISAFLKKHKVKIVNMSLGLPYDFKDVMGLKEAVRAYGKMIDDNPETLFIVASGNSAQNIDDNKNRQYPANFNQPNVMKVGSLDVSNLSEADPKKSKMSWFSNYGVKNVDILAPGLKVSAASLGGGLIAHSGTSMATPYMVHQAVQLWSELPHLTAVQVRELFIATAKKLDIETPVRSGGYVDLKAALLEGKLRSLNRITPTRNGPNCWNSATYLAGISKAIHYTGNEEFRFLIDSPLCQQVSKEEMQPGDMVAFRRYDRSNRLLRASFISEVHGYTYTGVDTAFSKNGTDKNIPYLFQDMDSLFNFYRSSEFKNCKMNGLDRQDCQMRAVSYRCVGLREYYGNKLNVFEKDVLTQIENLELHMQYYFVGGRDLNFDKEKQIQNLQKRLERLQHQGSPQLFIEALEARLSSLASIL